MKIAIIFTGTTPEMIGLVEREVRDAAKGVDLQLSIHTDPTIIADTIANGSVTPAAAARLVKMYVDAVTAGAEIVYNICSSIGDVVDAAQGVFKYMGVPLVRVDEEMAIHAIKAGKSIGVLATLRTTLDPTKRLVQRCADTMGTEVKIYEGLADGAFGKSGSELEQVLIDTALKFPGQVEVILLAQASMAMCEDKIAAATGKPVFSSPRYGAQALARVIFQLAGRGNKA